AKQSGVKLLLEEEDCNYANADSVAGEPPAGAGSSLCQLVHADLLLYCIRARYRTAAARLYMADAAAVAPVCHDTSAQPHLVLVSAGQAQSEGLSSRRRLRQNARAEIPPELPVLFLGVRQRPTSSWRTPGAQRGGQANCSLAIEPRYRQLPSIGLPPSALFDYRPRARRSFSAGVQRSPIFSRQPRRNRRQMRNAVKIENILAYLVDLSQSGGAAADRSLSDSSCSADTHLTDDDSASLTPRLEIDEAT
uniref:Pecanex-like protein n=1 Tax=Macrostomum lignano TaxID=282301 RepID=A0A1I8FJA2_9PLAT